MLPFWCILFIKQIIPMAVASFNGFHCIMCLLHCTPGWSVHDDATPAPGTLYHAGQPCCTSGPQARQTAIYRRHRYRILRGSVGQYMMTLPQHLEPFTMQDNPAVLVALRHGRLPYTDDTDIVYRRHRYRIQTTQISYTDDTDIVYRRHRYRISGMFLLKTPSNPEFNKTKECQCSYIYFL